ncbi:hypothetical protein [Limosilactobacillus mucosae]|uniref:Uncharacterized protein n=1 Tax=Limosilactobacillus mucosae TaxID=97478 RepID=A0AAJ1HM72_LIMMU|nr:hypothetical protein [Limosilactobacillus mucosae]MDC2826957.1 hypothetical protein [Limosilactobacillus mucosae]MDC2834672.1 hypothetical protein [Limosilactobacillus mucosae]
MILFNEIANHTPYLNKQNKRRLERILEIKNQVITDLTEDLHYYADRKEYSVTINSSKYFLTNGNDRYTVLSSTCKAPAYKEYQTHIVVFANLSSKEEADWGAVGYAKAVQTSADHPFALEVAESDITIVKSYYLGHNQGDVWIAPHNGPQPRNSILVFNKQEYERLEKILSKRRIAASWLRKNVIYTQKLRNSNIAEAPRNALIQKCRVRALELSGSIRTGLRSKNVITDETYITSEDGTIYQMLFAKNSSSGYVASARLEMCPKQFLPCVDLDALPYFANK